MLGSSAVLVYFINKRGMGVVSDQQALFVKAPSYLGFYCCSKFTFARAYQLHKMIFQRTMKMESTGVLLLALYRQASNNV